MFSPFNRFYQIRFSPNDIDKARINQKYRLEEKTEFINYIRQKRPERRKKLPRSSYAFAQQEGWGQLITSGRMKVKRQHFSRNSLDIEV